jgi:hypothetical protein
MAVASTAKLIPISKYEVQNGAVPYYIDRNITVSTSPTTIWTNEPDKTAFLSEIIVQGGVDNGTVTLVIDDVDTLIIDLKTKTNIDWIWDIGKEVIFSSTASNGTLKIKASANVKVTYILNLRTV